MWSLIKNIASLFQHAFEFLDELLDMTNGALDEFNKGLSELNEDLKKKTLDRSEDKRQSSEIELSEELRRLKESLESYETPHGNRGDGDKVKSEGLRGAKKNNSQGGQGGGEEGGVVELEVISSSEVQGMTSVNHCTKTAFTPSKQSFSYETESQFMSRWGGFAFDCKYCGAEQMQWKEISPNKWMPYDLVENEAHECPALKEAVITREQVIHYLQVYGFEPYVPRTISWKISFIASNKSQTLYFLFGKRAIDFKFYDFLRPLKLDAKGKMYTDGGVLVRNNYEGSDVNVHELTLELASRFITNSPVDGVFLEGHGLSKKEQIEALYKNNQNQ